MDILKVLLIVIEIATSVLLIGIILLQKSKDQGMGLAFGAGMGEALFGSRAGNVLTRATVVLGCIFLATTMLLAIVFTTSHETSIIDQRTAPLPTQAAAPSPERPSGGAGAPASQTASTKPGTTMMPGEGVDDTQPAPAPAASAPVQQTAPAATPAAAPEPAK